MTKHEEAYIQMIEENKQLFDEFMDIHDKYTSDSSAWQVKFNEIGEKVVKIIRDTERKLCSKQESGQYSHYSSNLSDKFWGLVRKDFPKIDFVGVKP